MGSNSYTFLEEDLPCPVCKKSLSSPGSPPKLKNKFKKKRTKGLPQSQAQKDTKKTKDEEEIVVAQCGHLFHKFCLRHFCYLIREGQVNPMCRVSCPLCQRNISMMSSQVVEYKVHQDKTTIQEKQYTRTSVMHSELSGQVDCTDKKLRRLSEQVQDGDHNLDMFRSHLRKLKSDLRQTKFAKQRSDNLKDELQQTDKMLSFMQSQHLKIVKKFIAKVKQKSPRDYSFFPRRLAPYLSIIEGDDRMVRDLGEIIVPIHLNNLKSDRQSLLKGILATVNDRLEQRKSLHDAKIAERSHAKALKIQKVDQSQSILQPRVIVKVRKSSVTILSSSVLTKESIQKIIRHVKNVPAKARKRIIVEDSEGKKTVTEEGAVMEHLSSSSDVKILFMPKRPALHQYSEPCRSIEDCDSFHVKVPTRRCRSTDAVIMKTKKVKKQPKARDSRCKSSLTLDRKKSNSIAKICSSKPEKIEKLEILLLNAKPESSCGETNAIYPNHETTQEEYEPETNSTKDDPQKDGMIDVNNNLLPDDDQLISPAPSANESPSPQNIIVGQNKTVEPEKSTTPPILPPRTSLLEMIYDELEEEKNFQASQSYGSVGWDSNSGAGGSEPLSQSRLLDDPDEWPHHSPQFFRVDRKGILHAEDPRHSNFRQPTFLGSTCNIVGKSDLVQSDEENQLNILSPEERMSLAEEKEEALTGLKNKFRSGRMRPLFHGIPACLGMPNGQFEASSAPQNTPNYMRKWQQQLSTGKSSKQDPTTHRIPASKFNPVRSQQRGSRMTTGRPQNVYQQQQFPHIVREETECSYLPPLSMYPVKRPSTDDCGSRAVTECGDYNRSGTEMTLDGKYDYFSGSDMV